MIYILEVKLIISIYIFFISMTTLTYSTDKYIYYKKDTSVKSIFVSSPSAFSAIFVSCPNLEHIEFDSESEELDVIIANCPKLKTITTDKNKPFNSIHIKRGCNNLNTIKIVDVYKVTIEDQSFNDMKDIHLSNIDVLNFNIERCCNLERLVIKYCNYFSVRIDSDNLSYFEFKYNNTDHVYIIGKCDNLYFLMVRCPGGTKLFIDQMLKSILYLHIKLDTCPFLYFPQKIDKEVSIHLKQKNTYHWTLKNFINRNLSLINLLNSKYEQITLNDLTFNS